MAVAKFEMLEWSARGNDLLERARTKLASAPSDKLRQLAERVPEKILSSDDTVVVVFAGQYSAGKSTILKVLTGREDIATGAGITTEQANAYDWEGIRVIDTPGVHTELRSDHDEITYRSIAEADLLVFVITNELFDSHLAEHFRKLAIERGKAHEMMLVVNKMQRCAKGNSPEAQDVIREDLRKVLAPFTPEELRTSYIDAEAALESQAEADCEVAAVLWKKSRFESFIQSLNEFVRDKGLAGRYTTALYNLEQILQEALAAESSGDKEIDGVEEVLLQRRRALLETQNNILHAVDGEIQKVVSEIRRKGQKVADMIDGSADQNEINQELQTADGAVQRYAEELDQSIQQVILKHLKGLDERVQAIANSELAKELLPRLELRINEISPDMASMLKKNADMSSQLGMFLVSNSFSPKAGMGLLKLNQYSGTAVHEAVKTIGHFFGKRFKPWEAVKWTRGIANIGRGVAGLGTLISIALQVKEDVDAAKRDEELRKCRAEVRSSFNDVAHVIEMHFDQAAGAYVTNTLTTEIEEVDKQLKELQEMQQTRTALFDDLYGLLEETKAMIQDLHAAGKAIG